MQKKIEIGLLMRCLRAITLGIGHCTADHHICRLRALEKCKKALVIFGAVFGVDIERHRVTSADRIEPDAALKARAGAASQFALHLVLGDKIARAGWHVQKSVD